MAQFSTGIECIDTAIDGGIKPDTITLIYGEPETGKTTLATQIAIQCAIKNNKILFVDCDNTFSTKRLFQIAGTQFEEVAEKIVLVKPKDFKEQTILIDNIHEYTTNVGLIVIDTLTSLYGAKVCEASNKTFTVNRELNRQLAILAQLVKTRKIPIVITSQVRSIINDQNESVQPVATRVLKFWAEIIIALRPTPFPQTIKAILEKPQLKDQETVCYVQIGENGIQDTKLQL